MAILGIDLHSDSFVVSCFGFDKSDKVVTSRNSYTLSDESFTKFKETLKPEDYVLIESSTNAFWFHDEILNLVKACYVFDTNKARREGNKTDKIDADVLAKKLAFFIFTGEDEKQMPTVYVPPFEIRELRGLFSTYNLYNKIQVQLKNRIHSILKQNGHCIARKELSKKKSIRNTLNAIKISNIWDTQINLLFDELQNIGAKQKEIKDLIILHGSKFYKEEIEILLSIAGFSAFTAIALLSDIVDIKRFANVKKFCSYLRTTPGIKASNKTKHLGQVNKASRSTTVTLL
jgi:transposase